MSRSLRGRLLLAHLLVMALASVAVALLAPGHRAWAIAAVLLALLAAAALAVAIAGRHARRLADLEDVARRLARDEREVAAPELPADEIGRLGRAINEMAAEGRARLETLRRERDEREHILAHMSDGVVLLDAIGRVLRCNHSLAALLDAPRPANPGTRFTSYVRVPELHDLVVAARAEGRPIEEDVRLWAPRNRLLHATAIPFASGETGGEPGDVLLVLRDLTDVERLGRVRQDFVANVSHELRTPLTSIRGYAETLLEGGLDDPEHRVGFVETIRNNAVRLEALAGDLLTLADLDRPGATLRGEAFDLRILVEAQAAAFRGAARQVGLALEVEPGEPVPVEADRPRMEQVVANLLDNAIKYTEQGGVRVRLGTDAGRAWCEVEDTGPGVPEEDRPRVFERFYRVDKARSRAKGGTGLGLSIVRNIILLHGGEVSLRPAPLQGSIFRFEIPGGTGAPGRG